MSSTPPSHPPPPTPSSPHPTNKPKKLFLATDPFGAPLHETLLPYLKEAQHNLEVVDIGNGDYYEIAAQVAREVAKAPEGEACGVVLCGTGMGVGIAANKIAGVRAAVAENVAAAVNAKSVNNANVLALGAMVTQPETAKEIVHGWLNASFKGPAPANKNEGWPEEIQGFLTNSMPAIAKLEAEEKASSSSAPSPAACCAACFLQAGSSANPFQAVEGVRGAEWVELRQNPTRALVKFKAGAIEPVHHHTFGHDVLVLSGSKRVDNVTRGTSYELKKDSYLYTPAGEQHRVVYHEDTEFLIVCDGVFDVFWDEPWPEEEGGGK